MRRLLPLLALVPAPALAAAGEPAPQAEIRSMAITYGIACIALVLALGGARWLAGRR